MGKEKKKENINKQDYIELKTLHTAMEAINKMKRQPTEWENIFTSTSDKELISKIYKALIKLNTKKPQIIQLKYGKRI